MAPHGPRSPLPVPLRYALGLGALGMGSCNAFCAAYALGEAVTPTAATPVGFNVGLAIMCLGLLMASAVVAKRCLWPSRRPAHVDRELKVLACVAGHGGRVTVADVASSCQLGLADARAVLDEMARHGVAEMLFTPEGVPVFEFPGVLTAQQKEQAGSLVLEVEPPLDHGEVGQGAAPRPRKRIAGAD